MCARPTTTPCCAPAAESMAAGRWTPGLLSTDESSTAESVWVSKPSDISVWGTPPRRLGSPYGRRVPKPAPGTLSRLLIASDRPGLDHKCSRWDNPTVIVTLDAKQRLTVPAALAPATPGDYFDARFD